MSRMLRPETSTLQISQGDWLLVKKRLTAGEQRRIFARMVKSLKPGEKPLEPNTDPKANLELNPIEVGRATAVEYLLDWSIKDPDGKVVVIRDKSADVVGQALDALDMESFNEIVAAITEHEKAMSAEREAEKNGTAGETRLSTISPSAA